MNIETGEGKDPELYQGRLPALKLIVMKKILCYQFMASITLFAMKIKHKN